MMSNKVDITILIPTKNEELNLESCLRPLIGWAEKVLIVDSGSTDKTIDIAAQYGIEVIQFNYLGGWPKKRQSILENYSFQTEWILLLDSDEILTSSIKTEISEKITNKDVDGYYLFFKIEFLGRMLNYAAPPLRKLSLFRKGRGNFERRLTDQDASMGDMEVHEHVYVEGVVREIKSPVLHRNSNSISRFIIKHDEYSNYESRVHLFGEETSIKIKYFGGTKEEKRRFLKAKLIRFNFSPLLLFIYNYFLRFGFLDGRQGFYFVLYQSIYLYFVNSKMFEIEQNLKKTTNYNG
jgi:glycosyltransferase involved in cell wall biosynthesis